MTTWGTTELAPPTDFLLIESIRILKQLEEPAHHSWAPKTSDSMGLGSELMEKCLPGFLNSHFLWAFSGRGKSKHMHRPRNPDRARKEWVFLTLSTPQCHIGWYNSHNSEALHQLAPCFCLWVSPMLLLPAICYCLLLQFHVSNFAPVPAYSLVQRFTKYAPWYPGSLWCTHRDTNGCP